jgi:hypothetical protein
MGKRQIGDILGALFLDCPIFRQNGDLLLRGIKCILKSRDVFVSDSADFLSGSFPPQVFPALEDGFSKSGCHFSKKVSHNHGMC